MNAVTSEVHDSIDASDTRPTYPFGLLHVIRPVYHGDFFIGFAIHKWDDFTSCYKPVGKVFAEYKLAHIALANIRGDDLRAPRRLARGILNAVIAWLTFAGVILFLFGLLGGCSTVKAAELPAHNFSLPCSEHPHGYCSYNDKYGVDDWTTDNTVSEVAFQVFNILDALQTNRIQYRSDLVEGSSFTRSVIGAEPSTRDVALYFGTVAISHYLISRMLPAKWRPWWQNGTAVYSGYTVLHNCTDAQLCF